MHPANFSSGLATFVAVAKHNLQTVACFPFDLARENYARAVKAGLMQQSMLASARFGKTLNTLETIALGPLARHR